MTGTIGMLIGILSGSEYLISFSVSEIVNGH